MNKKVEQKIREKYDHPIPDKLKDSIKSKVFQRIEDLKILKEIEDKLDR